VLSKEELERYQRQMMLEGFGEAGQEKLKQSTVFIAGAGGLGSAIAIYLAAAGVGSLRIVDNDVVELSNLNRQILHWYEDIGKPKTKAAKTKLECLNPNVKVEIITETITEANVIDFIGNAELILDALDNFPTRYILNKAAVIKNIPFFHGAINGFNGMVTTIIPKKTACLRCLFPSAPPSPTVPVIGVTPAIIGSIQATEAIKYVVGIGQLLTNRLLIFDGLSCKFNEVSLKRNQACPDCGDK